MKIPYIIVCWFLGIFGGASLSIGIILEIIENGKSSWIFVIIVGFVSSLSGLFLALEKAEE